jgi:hypothetical protein
MGLLNILTNIVTMPARVAVDVVKLPGNIVNGENVLQNTVKGIEKIEKDLED